MLTAREAAPVRATHLEVQPHWRGVLPPAPGPGGWGAGDLPAHFYRRSRRRHGEELVEAEGGALGAPDRGGGGPTVSEQSKAARLRVLQDSISRVVHIFDYSPKPFLEPADVHGTP